MSNIRVNSGIHYNNSRYSSDKIDAVKKTDTYNKVRTLRDDEETMIYNSKKTEELNDNEKNALLNEIDKSKTSEMTSYDFYEKEQFTSNINKDILLSKNKTK
ncbi:MAG: hypothetical protein IJS56_02850 [Bacilli bacterium]|nr:hypothetical protein [Bacilli bacterium]